MGTTVLTEIEQGVGSRTLPRDLTLPTTRMEQTVLPAQNSSLLPSESFSPWINTALEGQLKAAEKDLAHIHMSYVHSALSYTPIGPLSFVQNPAEIGEYDSREGPSGLNTGRHALKIGDPKNHAFIEQERLLGSLINDADSVQSHGSQDIQMSQKELVAKIQANVMRLNSFRQGEWERQRIQPEPEQSQLPSSRFWVNTRALVCSVPSTSSNLTVVFLAPYFKHLHDWHPVILASHLIVLIMSTIFHLPRRGSDVLLATLRCIVRLLTSSGTTSRGMERDIPQTFGSVLDALDIESRLTPFICCPKCYSLSPDTGSYNEMLYCPNQYAPGSPFCDAKLLRQRTLRGRPYLVPIRKFLHQSMKEWMGRFLSRPGIEDLMEKTTAAALAKDAHDPLTRDILESPGLTQFLGPDGKPFVLNPDGESRYFFSLAADAFNPFGNKEAKQKSSVTGIYLVCLNLPPNVRHRPENMYLVGIIPGPGKPSLAEINHFLKLLVADLKDFWAGVSFSHTAKYGLGRRVRCALVPVICDALGARQVGGIGSVGSKFFCTFCYLNRADMENFDRSLWPVRDPKMQRVNACAWLEADSEKRERLFKENGIRWSELLELPYWDPVNFLVIDSMHNLYLGLFQRHCRDLWGMNIKHEDGDGSPDFDTNLVPFPGDDNMKVGESALMTGSRSRLKALKRPILYYLCVERDIRRAGTKAQLIDGLLDWV